MPTASTHPDSPRPVTLPHTRLTVPHTRLTATALRQLPVPGGVALHATLTLDQISVGALTNHGDGGPTTYHPRRHSRLRPDQLTRFATGCRLAGRALPLDRVLDLLIDEYDLARLVRDCARHDQTLAILDAPDGTPLTLTVLPTDPGTHPARLTHARHAAAGLGGTDPAATWRLWTGTGWQTLTTA